jgi:uncharacterized protein (DUF1015 family)
VSNQDAQAIAENAGPLVRPFVGLRPPPRRAAEFAAPPYDVLSSDEARVRAAGRPDSFLHITKPEIEFPPGAAPTGAALHEHAGARFRALCADGRLVADPTPRYTLYRLTRGGHSQTGVVLAASIDAYREGRIRRHELTRPDKEDDRVLNIEGVGAQTEPVLLVHRPDPVLSAEIEAQTAAGPEVTFIDDEGVGHALWPLADEAAIERLNVRLNGLDALYIADGHHRSAAAARIAERQSQGAAAWFLAVAYSAESVRILDYNRVVRDLGGLSAEGFLDRLGAEFAVTREAAPVRPGGRHEFGLVLAEGWYRLSLHNPPAADAPALARLDVALLASRLLEPILGITEPRTDPRIDFIGGVRGLAALEAAVASGDWAAGFALYPTAIEDLMAVADAGLVMPPKSTWFDPKLADGLVCYPFV